MSATNREGKSFNDGTWSKTQMTTPTQTLPRDEWTARANQRMRDLLVPEEIIAQYDSGTWSWQYDDGETPEDSADAEVQEMKEAS